MRLILGADSLIRRAAMITRLSRFYLPPSLPHTASGDFRRLSAAVGHCMTMVYHYWREVPKDRLPEASIFSAYVTTRHWQ